MFTLYKKELSYYLNNPVGYIVITLFAVFANFLYVKDIFIVGSASLRPFFLVIPWLFLIFIPAISMRSLAEEKRTNTIEVLLTLPLSEAQIILAKFFALLTIVSIAVLLTLGLPISLIFVSKVYIPEIVAGYIGIMFLASACISLSLFFSSLTKNQVVAFLVSAITLFLFIVLSTEFAVSVLPKFVQDYLIYFSPVYHLQNFVKGVLDVRSLTYFVSFTVLFLFLTIVDLEKRS